MKNEEKNTNPQNDEKTVSSSNKSSMHSGHRQKLRNRFVKEGIENFEDHNVLELLLFSVIPRKDTNPIAHRLIERFGSFYEVLEAEYDELIQVEGVGEQVAAFLILLPQMFKRYNKQRMEAEGIYGKEEICDYIANHFVGDTVEKVTITLLDNRFRMIATEYISEGSVNFSAIDIRKLLEYTIKHNATQAIIAHNHPRGLALPSQADLSATVHIREILALINVELVDHVIVAPDDYICLSNSKDFSWALRPLNYT